MRRLHFIAALATLACGRVIAPSDDDTTSTTTSTSTSSSTSTTDEPTTDATSTTTQPTTDPTNVDTSSSTATSDTTGCGEEESVETCDPWLQDCCPGEKCIAWGVKGVSTWTAFRCSPIAEDADAIGDPCSVEGSAISGIDTCEDGAFCFYVDPETNIGVCAALCRGAPDAPICDDAETTCTIEYGDFITLCLETCDPLDDACDVGICAPTGDAFVCGLGHEQIPIGEQCWHHWDCEVGAACTSADRLAACEGDRCCAPYCDITLPDPCGEGFVCDPWYREGQYPGNPPPYGVCVL